MSLQYAVKAWVLVCNLIDDDPAQYLNRRLAAFSETEDIEVYEQFGVI